MNESTWLSSLIFHILYWIILLFSYMSISNHFHISNYYLLPDLSKLHFYTSSFKYHFQYSIQEHFPLIIINHPVRSTLLMQTSSILSIVISLRIKRAKFKRKKLAMNLLLDSTSNFEPSPSNGITKQLGTIVIY